MNIGRSFTYITEDQDWIKKVLIAWPDLADPGRGAVLRHGLCPRGAAQCHLRE